MLSCFLLAKTDIESGAAKAKLGQLSAATKAHCIA